MLCHPTLSDLSVRRSHRIFPGVRLWGGLRPGSDVLDLPGRVQGGSSRRQPAEHPGASAQHAFEDRSHAETLTLGEKKKFKQHKRANRVGLRRLAGVRRGQANLRSACAMTKGTDTPALHNRLFPSPKVQGSSLRPLSDFRVDGLGTPGAHGHEFSQSFRRITQKNAVGGEIPPGADHTSTKRFFSGTSCIVLVTPVGNVTVFAH